MKLKLNRASAIVLTFCLALLAARFDIYLFRFSYINGGVFAAAVVAYIINIITEK